MTVTYKHNGLQPFSIAVKLDGKYTGSILRARDGYRYRTKCGLFGPTFATVAEVKASIEGTDA